jgi:hypothetical protein
MASATAAWHASAILSYAPSRRHRRRRGVHVRRTRERRDRGTAARARPSRSNVAHARGRWRSSRPPCGGRAGLAIAACAPGASLDRAALRNAGASGALASFRNTRAGERRLGRFRRVALREVPPAITCSRSPDRTWPSWWQGCGSPPGSPGCPACSPSCARSGRSSPTFAHLGAQIVVGIERFGDLPDVRNCHEWDAGRVGVGANPSWRSRRRSREGAGVSPSLVRTRRTMAGCSAIGTGGNWPASSRFTVRVWPSTSSAGRRSLAGTRDRSSAHSRAGERGRGSR